MRTAITLLMLLALSSSAWAQGDEESLNRLDELKALQKVAKRGIAAGERADEKLGKAATQIDGIEVKVADIQARSKFDPMPWILGGLGVLCPAVAAPIVIARRAAKNASKMVSETLNQFAQPAQEAGRTFQHNEESGEGNSEVRRASAGGRDRANNHGNMSSADLDMETVRKASQRMKGAPNN